MKEALIKTTSGNSYIIHDIESEFSFISECSSNNFIIARKNFIKSYSECYLKTSSIESIEFIYYEEE